MTGVAGGNVERLSSIVGAVSRIEYPIVICTSTISHSLRLKSTLIEMGQ